MTTVVIPARLAPGDSACLTSPWRSLAAFIASLLEALALNPVSDLVQRVDRMSIRSLLARSRSARQPDAAWTINWIRWVQIPHAVEQTLALARSRLLSRNDKPLSRAPGIAESPTPRISAEHDETRAIDQRGGERDARRDSGGRRAS